MKNIHILILLSLAVHAYAYERHFTNETDYTNAWTLQNIETKSSAGMMTVGWYEGFDYADGYMPARYSTMNNDADADWKLINGYSGAYAEQFTNQNVFVTNGELVLGDGQYKAGLVATRAFNEDRIVTFRHYGRYPHPRAKCSVNTSSETTPAGYGIYYNNYQGKFRIYPINDGEISWGSYSAGYDIPASVIEEGYNTMTFLCEGDKYTIYHNGAQSFTGTREIPGASMPSLAVIRGESQPAGNDRYDYIRVIDTNIAIATLSNVNASADTGLGQEVFNVKVTADMAEGEGFVYTFSVRNSELDEWHEVATNQTYTFRTSGTNLAARIMMENLSGLSETMPAVGNIAIAYNFISVTRYSITSPTPVTNTFVMDAVFSTNIDTNTMPVVTLRYPNTTSTVPISASYISNTVISSNTIRITVRFADYMEENDVALPYGAYDVGISNVTANEGQMRLAATHYIAGALVYATPFRGRALFENEAGDRFLPAYVQGGSDGSTAYLYVFLTGEERVTVTIYDVYGSEVRSLVNGQIASGTLVIPWDGNDNTGASVRKGRYVVRIQKGASSKIVPVYVVE